MVSFKTYELLKALAIIDKFIDNKNKNILKNKYYNFLKKISREFNISPLIISDIISDNIFFIDELRRISFKEFKDFIFSKIEDEQNKIKIFVALYYSFYLKTKKIYKALLRAAKYPFLKNINLEFIKKVINTYKFLIDYNHLNQVEKYMTKFCIENPYDLVRNGVKENYEK